MINGDILKQYKIDPSNEVLELRKILYSIEEHEHHYHEDYRKFLIKTYSSSIIEIVNRIFENTSNTTDEMLNLIRILFEFENPLHYDYATQMLLYKINYYDHVLDRLNYTHVFDVEKDEVIIYKKDIMLENVAQSVTLSSLKWRLYEFNMFDSTLEDKVDTLRELYIYLENLKIRSKNESVNEAMRFLNVTRHGETNKDKKLLSQYQEEKTKKMYIELCFKLSMQALLSIEVQSIRDDMNSTEKSS